MPLPPKKTMVLGVGNLLMGDEGVGVRVARRLEERLSDPDTEIVDGGTGELHFLEYFLDRDRVILVDAVMDGTAPEPSRFRGPSTPGIIPGRSWPTTSA